MERYHSSMSARKLHQTAVIVHVNEADEHVPSCKISSQQTCPEQGQALGIVWL